MKLKRIMQNLLGAAGVWPVAFQLLYKMLLSRNKGFAFLDAPFNLIKFFPRRAKLAIFLPRGSQAGRAHGLDG